MNCFIAFNYYVRVPVFKTVLAKNNFNFPYKTSVIARFHLSTYCERLKRLIGIRIIDNEEYVYISSRRWLFVFTLI